MLFKYFGFNNYSQCEIAGVVFEPQDCCNVPGSCDTAQLASQVFKDSFDFPFQPKDGTLTPVEIHDEIATDRPIEILWEWTGQANCHLVLIVGEYPTGDLEVIDPIEEHAQGRFSYEEVLDAGGQGAWIYSYFELNKV